MGLLSGLRILTVDQYGAGPYAALHLADLGAQVIKIEHPDGGDYARTLPPFSTEERDDSLFFQALNRNKQSIALDIAEPRGRAAFRRLVANSDAVMSNLRSGAAQRLGIDYQSLSEFNPRIVCGFLTGFGREGARRDSAGFDYMVQAESGIMSLAGDPDGPPVKAGVSIIDFSAGIASAFALLAGITSARASGRGCDVDVSLQDTASSLLNYVATWYLSAGYETLRLADSAHPSLVPSQLFRCSDRDIIVMVNKEAFWPKLSRALGRPKWATQVDRSTFAARLENRTEVLADLAAEFARRSADEWLGVLRAHGVPCAPVRTVREAFSDPEYLDRTVGFKHEHFGEVRSPGPLVTPADIVHAAAPALGAHSIELLRDLAGLSSREIAALITDGVVKTTS